MNFGSSTNLFNYKKNRFEKHFSTQKIIQEKNKENYFIEQKKQILQIEKKLLRFQQNFLNQKRKKEKRKQNLKKVSSSSKFAKKIFNCKDFNICPSLQSFEDFEEDNKYQDKFQSMQFTKLKVKKKKKIKKKTKEQKIKKKYKTFARISKLHYEALIKETFVFIQLTLFQIQI